MRLSPSSPASLAESRSADDVTLAATTISRERSSDRRRYFEPRGRAGPAGGAWPWSTPTRRGSCIGTSSRATCCWTSGGSSGSPTSAWPRSRAIAGLTITGELLGTLRYASPEQVLARRGIVDHRSDVYSLGATLYELLTLRPPFEGRDRNDLIRQIADDDPAAPCAWTARSLASWRRSS